MPAPTKKTPARLKRLLDLTRGGKHSITRAASMIGIDKRTAGVWLEEAGASPATSAVADLAAKLLADAQARPSDRSMALEVLHDRLAVVRGLLKRVEPALEHGEYPAASYAALCALEEKAARAIVELSPPEALDPELDPANQEAATAVRGRLARLVEQAERSSLCLHCGKPPFVKESQ